jgi:hypothetical protein
MKNNCSEKGTHILTIESESKVSEKKLLRRRRGRRVKTKSPKKCVFEEFLDNKDSWPDLLPPEVLEEFKNRALKRRNKAGRKVSNQKGAKMVYTLYSTEEKEFCLRMLSYVNHLEVVKLTGVPGKSLIRWTKVGCERRKGGGRKGNTELNEKVKEYCEDYFIENQYYPSPLVIRKIAKKLANDDTFAASKGWLEKFKLRYLPDYSKFCRRKLRKIKKTKIN